MYRIKIEKVSTETKMERGEWTVIRDEVVTESESGEACDPTIKHIHGWTPAREVEREWTQAMLIQEVDELDLPAVIRAINGI